MVVRLVLSFVFGIVFVISCGFWQGSLGKEVVRRGAIIGQATEQLVVPSPINSEKFKRTRSHNIVGASRGARELVQQAFEYYSSGQYTEAIVLWEEVLRADGKQTLLSTADKSDIHANLGAAYRKIGQLSSAIVSWRQAVELYRQAGNEVIRGMVLVDLASAHNALGQGELSIPMLTEAIDIARKTRQKKLEAIANAVLGMVYSETGELDKAISVMYTSLKLAPIQDIETQLMALNNLGKALTKRSKRYSKLADNALNEGDLEQFAEYRKRSEQDFQGALAVLEDALESSKAIGGIWQVNTTINLASVLQANLNKQAGQAQVKRPDIESIFPILSQLPDSRSKAYALINSTLVDTNSERKIRSLEQAISAASHIGDLSTESYALGILGHIYESSGNFDVALEKTRSAIVVAQQVFAQDSLYRWQWQAGRILAALGNNQQAITFYKQAIGTLQSIRSDIIASSVDLQFDVRDEVEPIYRELIGLLLDGEPTDSTISQALDVSGLLKLTELQDYFGDDCLQVQELARGATKDSNTSIATIYSLILTDKTYMILQGRNGLLKSYLVARKSKELLAKISQFRKALEDVATNDYLDLSQQLYNLLMRPMEKDLTADNPQTLVFVNDGLLRNVPMAVLNDGKQFLVEKYSIAISPGFNFSDYQQPQQNLRALTFGLTVPIPPFAALPSVATETQEVQKLVGGSRFLDADFTLTNFKKQVQANNYPIVHLATHGKFGATADSTFLQAFDTRVNLKQFEDILGNLKHPLNLLTLSACQTAAGDNRSTLGLAGVAVRNGVKNVLATLWFVNDADTVRLIQDFYTHLSLSGMTPATAMRKAQINLITQGVHPTGWSAFVLISNSL